MSIRKTKQTDNALEPDYRRYAILFVDDEEITRHYFARICKPHFEVLTAENVNDALEVLEREHERIAILLTDQRMPGLRGGQLLMTARKLYPDIVRMLTTAYMDIDEAIESVNQGEIFRYLDKPWDIETLRSSLFDAMHLFLARKKHRSLMDYRREGLFMLAGRIAEEIGAPLRQIIEANAVLTQRASREVLSGDGQGGPADAERVREALARIEAESKKALMFVEMLQLNFHEDQSLPEWDQSHSMKACLTEALMRFPFRPGERERFNVQQGSDFSFSGPQVMMVHVFFNLIRQGLNAIGERLDNGGVVEISLHPGDDINQVIVRDNGGGLSGSQIEKLFEESSSDDPGDDFRSTANLAYCRKTMTYLGGRIDCVSDEGRSTQFTLSLPVSQQKLG